MTTKYTNSIDSNTAIMLLYDYVGQQYDKNGMYIGGISGEDFAREMYYHKNIGRDVLVKINSPGGSVMDGWSMIEAVMTCEANTQVVGMAASMAGVLSQFGKKRLCNDFASLMIHAPQGKDSPLLAMIKDQLQKCLMTRSKLKKEQLDEMMDGKKETWFDASDMIEMGLVDEIIQTGLKNPFAQSQNKTKNIFGNFVPELENSYQLYTNLIRTQEKPKKQEMEITAIASKLKLENASEEKVMSAIDTLIADNKATTDKVKNLEDENAKLKTEAKKYQTDSAEALVNAAIGAGKIKEAEKALWVESAIENFDRTKKIIDAMEGKAFTSVSAAVESNKKVDNTASGLKPEETYEYLAENDPEKLKNLAATNFEQFQKLQKEMLKRKGVKNATIQIEN